MRKPTHLELRGTVEFLKQVHHRIVLDPWEPGWYYPEIDKGGQAQAVEDALDIIRKALRSVEKELHASS